MPLPQFFPGVMEKPIEHVTKDFAQQSHPLRLLQKALPILRAYISALNSHVTTNTPNSSSRIPNAKVLSAGLSESHLHGR